MFCPHCGEGNRDDAEVCELCTEVMPGRVHRASVAPLPEWRQGHGRTKTQWYRPFEKAFS